jgi:hypothetical protein
MISPIAPKPARRWSGGYFIRFDQPPHGNSQPRLDELNG